MLGNIVLSFQAFWFTDKEIDTGNMLKIDLQRKIVDRPFDCLSETRCGFVKDSTRSSGVSVPFWPSVH